MNAVEIKIKTEASGTGAQDTAKHLTALSAASKKVAVDIASAEKELKRLQATAEKKTLGQKLMQGTKDAIQELPGVGASSRALNGAAPIVGGSLLAIGAGLKLAADSIRAFAASEVEMAKLDAALANSGKLTDVYREKLSKLATERSGKTGIDDEKYLGVFTTLTKFGADTGNIDKYTSAVENLAGFMGGDMEQAAFLFGKAMQGQTEMLGRYGISVDKSRSQSEQLADIMRQLEARGAGQLEAMANTLDGSFKKISNSWENLLESFGSLAEKAGLATYFSKFAGGLQIIADKLGGGSPAKSKNREELVGATPEEQKAADDIAAQRKEIERLKLLKQQDSAQAIDELMIFIDGPVNLLGKADRNRKSDLDTRIGSNDNIIGQLDAALANLDAKEKALNLRRVTPEEATNIRTQMSGGTPEEIAAKEKLAKEKALNQEKQTGLLLDQKIADAALSGNTKEEARLKWVKQYDELRRQAKSTGMGEAEAVSYATSLTNAAQRGDGDKNSAKPAVDVIGEAMEVAKAARSAMPMSAMARMGMAMGENSSASPVLNKLGEMIEAQRKSDELRKRTANAVEKIERKKQGYAV